MVQYCFIVNSWVKFIFSKELQRTKMTKLLEVYHVIVSSLWQNIFRSSLIGNTTKKLMISKSLFGYHCKRLRVLITSANTYQLEREREDKKAMTTPETEETLLLLHLLSFLHMLSITIVVIFSIYFHIRQVWKDRKIDRDDGEFCENSDAIIEKGGPCELLLNEVLFFICPFIQLFT